MHMKHGPKHDPFDEKAAGWDEDPVKLKLAEDVSAAMLRAVRFERGMSVLDFGCGTGLVTLRLRGLVDRVTGADTSKGMLAVLERKIAEGRIGNVATAHLDERGRGAFERGPYHAIVSSMTLHHIEDLGALLGRFYEALLPGGVLAVADLDEEGGLFHDKEDGVHHSGFDRKQLAGIVSEAGFLDVRHETAGEVHKPDKTGEKRAFSVFLLTARKR